MENIKEKIFKIFSSDHFCSHLFLDGTIYPGTKWVPCCKASGTKIGAESLISHKYEDYINGEFIKSLRSDLKNKKENDYCKACTNLEKVGAISDRIKNNLNMYKIINENNLEQQFVDIWNVYEKTGIKKGSPWHFYLFLDNTCQARCVMCDASFSSSIEKEYANLNLPNIFLARNQTNEKVVKNFPVIFEELKKHASSIKILQLLGGEPTISKDCLEILEWLVDNKYSENIFLKINTNGIVLPDKWIEVCKKFYKVQWSVSVDATGDLNTWIRYPTNWQKLQDNLKKITEQNFYYTMINTTVHAMNVHFLPELYQWTKEKNLPLNFVMAYSPKEITVHVLNESQRKSLKEKYTANKEWMQVYGAVVLKLIEEHPMIDNKKLLHFIEILEKVRPTLFEKVNPYFKKLI